MLNFEIMNELEKLESIKEEEQRINGTILYRGQCDIASSKLCKTWDAIKNDIITMNMIKNENSNRRLINLNVKEEKERVQNSALAPLKETETVFNALRSRTISISPKI